MPTYINSDVKTSVRSSAIPYSYEDITLIPGIAHSAQIEIYREFTVDRNNITKNTTGWSTAGWTPTDFKKAYVYPNFLADNITARVVFNETNKTFTINTNAPSYYDYTDSNGAIINVPVITPGTSIIIRRKTYLSSPLVTWSVGNKISSSQLNLQTNQLLYLIQELNDRILDTNSITNTSSVGVASANTAASVSDGCITPIKLSTGGPSWNTSSDLTVAGVLGTNGNFKVDTTSPVFQVIKSSGNTTIGGTLVLTGAATLNNLTASLPVVTNSSKVLTSATVTGTGSTIVMSNAPTIVGLVTAGSLLTSGTITSGGLLTSVGITSSVNISAPQGNISCSGTLTAGGATTLSTTLAVTGTSTLTGAVSIPTAALTIGSGNLAMTSGSQTITAGNLTVTSGTIAAGSFITSGTTTAGNTAPTANNHLARKDYVDNLGRIGWTWEFFVLSAATPTFIGYKPSLFTATGTTTAQTVTIAGTIGSVFIGYYQVCTTLGVPKSLPVTINKTVSTGSSVSIGSVTTSASEYVKYVISRTV